MEGIEATPNRSRQWWLQLLDRHDMEEDNEEEELVSHKRVSIDPPSSDKANVGILVPPLPVPVPPLPVTAETTTKNVNIMRTTVNKELPKKKASKLKFKNLQRRIRIEGD